MPTSRDKTIHSHKYSHLISLNPLHIKFNWGKVQWIWRTISKSCPKTLNSWNQSPLKTLKTEVLILPSLTSSKATKVTIVPQSCIVQIITFIRSWTIVHWNIPKIRIWPKPASKSTQRYFLLHLISHYLKALLTLMSFHSSTLCRLGTLSGPITITKNIMEKIMHCYFKGLLNSLKVYTRIKRWNSLSQG